MTCDDVLDLVDAIAAGDIEADAAVRAHLESCSGCASALVTARRIEALLASRPAPPAPARFTESVTRQVRLERWRTEQSVDRVFNVSIAVGLAIVVGGIAALINLDAMLVAIGAAWSVVSAIGSDVAKQAVPTLATYVAAFGLLLSTLVIWWWAERRLSV